MSIHYEDLRQFCTCYNYFTKGSCLEYEQLFNMIPANGIVKDRDILKIARLIVKCSDDSAFEEFSFTEEDFLKLVLYGIYNGVVVTYIEL